MKNFEDFLKELKSDELWAENASIHHKPETFEKAARKVYMQCVADGAIKTMQECRKHVYNIIVGIPGDKPKVDWVGKALDKIKKQEEEKRAAEFAPASDEHVAKCVAEFDEMIKKAPMMNAMPRVGYKQAVEEGDWIPKKKEYTPPSAVEKIIILKESKNRIRECRRKFFLDAFPDASEEEIHAYWQKFEDTKDESI